MAGTRSQWLMGCGIGCAAVLVLAIVGGVLLFRSVKTTFKDFETVEETTRQLNEAYATIETYAPPADGRLPADRVEAFLRVQQAALPQGELLSAAARDLEALDRGGFSLGKIGKAFSGIKSMGQGLGRYLVVRNQALLDEGMGLGEYTYLLATVYYGWLQKPLDVAFENDDDTDYHLLVARTSRGFLQRQLKAVEESGGPGELADALRAELDRMLSDERYVPWKSGVPAVIEDSLAPYRGELDAAYSDVGTLLGMASETDEGGGIRINAD